MKTISSTTAVCALAATMGCRSLANDAGVRRLAQPRGPPPDPRPGRDNARIKD